MDDTFPLGPAEPLVVALKRPADIERVGPTARAIARSFDAPIEVVTIIGPDDDLADEARLFAEVADALDAGEERPACCRIVVDEHAAEAFFERCIDRVVCMATAASPFKDGHYVGSFASGLLSRSAAPVFLVGPSVADGSAGQYDEVVAAVSDDSASLTILPYARALAATLNLPVATVHIDRGTGNVFTNEYGDAQLWFPDSVHASLGVEALDGDAVASTLLNRSVGALVAVATSARQGLAWIAEGSVAFDVISHATSPVLAVGPEVGTKRDTPSHTTAPVWLTGQTPSGAADELVELTRDGADIDEVVYSRSDTDLFDRF